MLAALAGILPTAGASAAIRLSNMFSNHLVLQRNMRDPVWGWANPGQKITVHFAGHLVTATSDAHGAWMAELPPMRHSSRPRTLTISSGSQNIVLHDVLVGDVWLCSGQSNMQYPMAGWFHRTNLASALAHGTHPNIRLYHVPMIESNFSGTPKNQAPAAWQRCTPKNLAQFSAVGYFFGLTLHKDLNVPIGLIESDWGGTNIDPWIPRSGYFAVPQLKADQAWLRAMAAQQKMLNSQYLAAMSAWLRKAKQAVAAGKSMPRRPAKPLNAISSPHAFDYHIPHGDWQPDPHQNPTTLFNGMINPLIPYAIRGAIWYQGENNVSSHDVLYYYHLKALIGSWRKLWHEGNFPFYIVQIAPFNYGGDGRYEPLIWQAEEKAARRIPNCGIVSTLDIGNVHNIHPANKLAVGSRLARLAMARTFHLPPQGAIYSGPVFKSAEFSGKQVVIHFTQVGRGLVSRNGKRLNWFQLAGGNGKFVDADAQIVGKTVVVHAPQISDPMAVRFAWSDIAVPNLMNAAGLPALPFKSRKP
jgi:sialate O-acetylesterase